MKKETVYTSPYEFKGRIPLKFAIPLGIQHVLARFVGTLTPSSSSAGPAASVPKTRPSM